MSHPLSKIISWKSLLRKEVGQEWLWSLREFELEGFDRKVELNES